MKYYLSTTPQGPIARFIAGVLALCAIAAVVAFGLIAFVILVAVISLAFVVAWVRVWWLRRGLKNVPPTQPGVPGQHSVIEAEYKVISRRND